MSAFVVVGAVVCTVAAWIVQLAAVRAGDQPERVRTDVGTAPSYAIADRAGRTLARFVPRFDLELSPRSMWQAHTPLLMAEAVSAALGGDPPPKELLERFLPDARDGVIRARAWRLSTRQARRLSMWIDSGAGSGAGPLGGIWLERLEDERDDAEPAYGIAWQPIVLLSADERRRNGTSGPGRWARRVAGGIAAALDGPTTGPRDDVRARTRRSEVWAGLMPHAYQRAVVGIPADRVEALRQCLTEQRVSALQMRVAFARDRFYPAGGHELFGSWGFLRPEQTEASPRAGLELLCERYLEHPIWEELIRRHPSVYRWEEDKTVRGQRSNGYLAFEPGSAAPVVETTLDLALQRFVRQALEDLMVEHRPALAMAIVVDVANGDVLAVDSVEQYEIQPFAPTYHVFTTGSTLKVITMASALQEGVIRPNDMLDVGEGAYRIHYSDGRKSGRVIREALGAPQGRITATEAFTKSCNAGLAQIGLRVSDEAFRGYLAGLGYGRAAGAGLGVERAGHLAPLPWKYAWTHTSVCFGHEISTTLWQHAAALASVVRGGVYRPLRIVCAVEQDIQAQEGRRWELALEPGVRVFDRGTCETVRGMMQIGAQEGTGRDARLELERIVAESLGIEGAAGLVALGTKTGTAQKVGGETCVHVELSARNRWREAGIPATRDRVRALRAVATDHRSCYTSSICAFGSRVGEEREILVLVVAEEPRGKERFGSKVSGPTAARILAEALAFTRDGATPRHDLIEGFVPSDVALRNDADEPWREGREW